jgi:hypothetical protein
MVPVWARGGLDALPDLILAAALTLAHDLAALFIGYVRLSAWTAVVIGSVCQCVAAWYDRLVVRPALAVYAVARLPVVHLASGPSHTNTSAVNWVPAGPGAYPEDGMPVLAFVPELVKTVTSVQFWADVTGWMAEMVLGLVLLKEEDLEWEW